MFALLGWADAWDKKTILTVKEPIQVPGAVLQPGTYVIKLVDSLSDRHIVRIMNERENEVITTFLAIPNERLKPTGDTQFKFWETPVGNPPALRAWFYPGDNFGQEIAYPHGMSVKIAEYASEPVPSVNTTKEAELAMAPLTVEKPMVEKPMVEKPMAAQVYEPAPPAPLKPAPVPEVAQTVQQADRQELPTTASPLPALALAGFLTLGAGLALRRVTA
jgi:hypothetical protein